LTSRTGAFTLTAGGNTIMIFRHLAALFALVCASASAQAQEWPLRTPIRIIVPYAAGSPLDLPARLLADRLTVQNKGTYILDHKPGAGGTVGTQVVVQSPPDGYTFLFTTGSVAMGPALYPSLPFDPVEALTPITIMTDSPSSIIVRPASELKNFADLLAKAKAAPGKYTFGTGGVGSSNHLAGELFQRAVGIKLLHVPYRGTAPSMTALYGGEVDMVVASTAETLAHTREGRTRMLVIASPQRYPELPDVPTVAEVIPGYQAANWYAFFAPRGLPAAIADQLAKDIAVIRQDKSVSERLAQFGMQTLLTDAAQLHQRMATEVPRWKKIVADAGIKAE
jgi:tripartite-type tricarboxylate transporter receptor subunit TctC